MSDVRQAAERLLAQVEHGSRPLSPRDAMRVATAYLSEHPADDGEPVSEEWLRSVGFDNSMTLSDRRVLMGSPLVIESAGKLDGGLGGDRRAQVFALYGRWWANGLECATCKTRGDVRRLAKALGIEIKESR